MVIGIVGRSPWPDQAQQSEGVRHSGFDKVDFKRCIFLQLQNYRHATLLFLSPPD